MGRVHKVVSDTKNLLSNITYVFRHVAKGKVRVLLGILAIQAITAFVPFIGSFLQGEIINTLVKVVSGQGQINYLWTLVGANLIMDTVPQLIYTVSGFLTMDLRFHIERFVNIAIAQKRAALDVATIESPEGNDLMSKIDENGQWRLNSMVSTTVYFISSAITLITSSAILISHEWWLIIIILLGTIPEFVTDIRYDKHVWNIHDAKAQVRRRYYNIRQHFGWIPYLIELKLFGLAQSFIDRAMVLFTQFQRDELNNHKLRSFYRIITQAIAQITLGIASIVYIKSVLEGKIQIGTLTFLLSSLARFRGSFSSILSNISDMYDNHQYISDYVRFMELEPMIKNPQPGLKPVGEKSPKIEFDGVWFKYPGTKNYILKDINLTIEPGEMIALVGINGAGKSTLLKLLFRFYDPTKGTIRVNGVDMKEIEMTWWQSQLGVLLQDYANYRFLTKEVIHLGDTSKKLLMPEVEKAAKKGEAHGFIKKWEKGYDQMLGKEFTGGFEPSIGQWQKLALSRLFLS
ncbi:MAG: putative multidrug export ATP-binding/permease protein [Microgenomates bacterium OLB22]|nr:MAG: putative multidrug export ATP-binding/permease protein [Microgenomates bacterium OLB22]